MASSVSLPRPRSRCSRTSNDGGRTNTVTRRNAAGRTCPAPCTSMTRTTSLPEAIRRSASVAAGPVEVAEDVGVLEELAAGHHGLEGRPRHEIIVHPVAFPGSSCPGRVAARHRQLGHHLDQALDDRRLAGPRGRRHDEELALPAACRHSTFWTCSLIFSSSALAVTTSRGGAGPLGLGAYCIHLAVHLLQQKVELSADRLARRRSDRPNGPDAPATARVPRGYRTGPRT